jgi:hypothetical protein
MTKKNPLVSLVKKTVGIDDSPGGCCGAQSTETETADKTAATEGGDCCGAQTGCCGAATEDETKPKAV